MEWQIEDPEIDPNSTKMPKDDEYAYSDRDSSVKLYSTNLVKQLKQVKLFHLRMWMNLRTMSLRKWICKFIDNVLAGMPKSRMEIEDPELFEQSKENPWAKD